MPPLTLIRDTAFIDDAGQPNVTGYLLQQAGLTPPHLEALDSLDNADAFVRPILDARFPRLYEEDRVNRVNEASAVGDSARIQLLLREIAGTTDRVTFVDAVFRADHPGRLTRIHEALADLSDRAARCAEHVLARRTLESLLWRRARAGVGTPEEGVPCRQAFRDLRADLWAAPPPEDGRERLLDSATAVEDLVRAVWEAVIRDTSLRGSVPTVVARVFDAPEPRVILLHGSEPGAQVMFVGYVPIPIGIGWAAFRQTILDVARSLWPQVAPHSPGPLVFDTGPPKRPYQPVGGAMEAEMSVGCGFDGI